MKNKFKLYPFFLGKSFEPITEEQEIEITIHHLYPQGVSKKTGEHKPQYKLAMEKNIHHLGWNKLFQFLWYKGKRQLDYWELNIQEIFYLFKTRHRFLLEKVGTKPWILTFGNNNLNEAYEMLSTAIYSKYKDLEAEEAKLHPLTKKALKKRRRG